MIEKYLTVRPREGLVIRTDDCQLIPPEGLRVKRTSHISRRLHDGDLIEVPAKTVIETGKKFNTQKEVE